MVYTYDWDETKPAGSRALNLGDDDIREFKSAIRERLQGGGMYFPSTDDDDAGIYNYLKFKEQSSNPTQEANRSFLFTKDVSSVTELYWMDSSGNVIQLTTGGKLLISSLGIASEARGDVITRGASAWQRLALGSANQSLHSDGTDAVWANCARAVLTTQGDVLYRDGSGLARLAAGTNGQFLMSGGAAANPSWVSGAYCAVGTYTGNGADDRNITVGFSNTAITPKAVLILDAGGSNDCWAATSGMGGTARKFSTNASATSDVIQAFSANTFQLGAGDANANAVTYYFIAWG